MTPGTTLTAQVRETIVTAMLAFSDHQRSVMIRAGVRFWTAQALPPESDALVQDGRLVYTTPGAARYFRPLRIVHLFSSGPITVPQVRHELAHCWDHVRRGNVHSVRGLSADALFAAISGSAPMTLSSTDLVERCLDLYRRRLTELVQSRRLRPGCRPQIQSTPDAEFYQLGHWGYPSHNALEFYAECYRIFHAPSSEAGAAGNQARLWLYAREMYDLLKHESRSERSPLPDPAAIQAAIRLECLPDPAPIPDRHPAR